MGRFTSADSIIPDEANPQDYSRFSYVGNNPTNHTDPTGHYANSCEDGPRYCSGGGGTGAAASGVAAAVRSVRRPVHHSSRGNIGYRVGARVAAAVGAAHKHLAKGLAGSTKTAVRSSLDYMPTFATGGAAPAISPASVIGPQRCDICELTAAIGHQSFGVSTSVSTAVPKQGSTAGSFQVDYVSVGFSACAIICGTYNITITN